MPGYTMKDDQTTNTDVSSSGESLGYSPTAGQISLDELHTSLANERRRLVLSYLVTHPEETHSIDDLVDVVAGCESPQVGPRSQRTRIEIDLYHAQLSKLADAGLIEYDPVDETAQYCGPKQLESLLAAGFEQEEVQ